MTYDEAIGYIHSVGWRGSKLGLERTRELLQKLGNPQNRLKFIHIAGTNGKGSVAAILSSVFRAAGLKTGLYTSPYIRRFNERMQLDGVPISDDALAELTQRVRVLAESMDDPPTEFEIITA
ncbi:MAG: bifunctional folylpolyglutamate synthase/dihydrofolate synthase, partial [Oscillospiraceae bacterium]